ncbi:AcrR family transcriptional regulator [Nocardiopsis mwathae]|uniref:AcrR family transcriptional regulator n=1 Tax=Nocardiopsis mwathae TaxID=1472723 RepID=A0A7W9YLJ9_9ACTN|nr:TetR/AcrR family transcriptional regulator [Nocardiopsis mwathae]MBB6173381.1 AcrR family transcriptional regulator [Nocardiopsis mwathae]
MTPPESPRLRRSQNAEDSAARRLRRQLQLQQSLADLLRHKSFRDISVTEVAAGAGISHSSVYTYYGDQDAKTEILRDAMDARFTALMSRVDLRFGRMEGFEEYIGRLLDDLIAFWEDSGGLLGAAMATSFETKTTEPEWWQGHMAPWEEALREAVEEARFADLLPRDAGDARPLVQMILGMVFKRCHDVLTAPHTDEDRAELHRLLLIAVLRILGRPC